VKILILGKGFIGSKLFVFLKDKFEVLFFSRQELDYTNRKILNDFLIEQKFDVVINCSGFIGHPNVDACEIEKEKCFFYNVSVPVLIANVCENASIKFINVSSGCIYTGYEKQFAEKDEPNFGFKSLNSSYYSFSKHLCEVLLRDTRSITLRIRMPFCGDVAARNLIYKVLKYDNIIDLDNSGTSVDDFSEFVFKLLNHSDFYKIKGPLNVINPGPLTCKLISEYLAFNGLTNPNWKIVKISDLKISAPRSNCILSDKKIKKLGLQLPCLAKSLKDAVSLFAKNYDAV